MLSAGGGNGAEMEWGLGSAEARGAVVDWIVRVGSLGRRRFNLKEMRE